ncbi:GNAT family N-acetyltransferase [Pleomorphomonas carboxyditropha]|uniref:N-acetyltransferase domain-containing protein n=1 Tax=Pleomorphomonas carboxyditropha TaxID=2023338 RepID=A0A2G9WQG2_9HYPH|nr:hypothetical protein CJ014_25700 [Pleomorphomonas carboxyditropha]
MYVRPDWQRRGAGSRLLLAGALGIQAAKRIEIRVLGSSPAAISFYRKHGFAEIDEELTEIFDKIEKPCLVMEVSVDTLKRLTVGS